MRLDGLREAGSRPGLLASVAVAGVAFFLLTGSSAPALTELDLTGETASVCPPTQVCNGVLNGALFYQFVFSGAGSGNIDEFVRYSKASADQTEGYNTDGSPFQYDELGGGFTHSILLDAVPLVTILGVNYREFAFDMNESGGKGAFLSLDEVEVYLAGVGDLLGHPFGALDATKVYDMDVGTDGDSRVLLDNRVNVGGGGKLDMLMYVPDSLFVCPGDICDSDTFVYLYSRVGEKADDAQHSWSNSDGAEAWVISEGLGIGPSLDPPIGTMIPEPGTLLLIGTGLAGLGSFGRRRRA